jgi:hypothetical protein
MADEMAMAERIVNAVGDVGLVAEYWSTVCSCLDAWSESQRLADALRLVALETGITPEAWDRIRIGGTEYASGEAAGSRETSSPGSA